MMDTAGVGGKDGGAKNASVRVSGPVVGWDFESLYVARYAGMVRLAYLLTGSMAHAEEAAQESFVGVYERWSRITDHSAYLRASVVNHCRSWHRSRLVGKRGESRLARADLHDDRPDEMADALARLPRRRREVIVLRFYEGLALADIAAVLGISEGTVKSTLHRALDELKGSMP
jgi:RNA polymerase sigma-70 factor (sigma-E family)